MRTKKKINIALIILLLNFLNCQKKENNSEVKTIINIDKIKQNSVGFSDKYESLPKLSLEEISIEEFNKLNTTKNPIAKIPINYKADFYHVELDNKIIKLKGKIKKTVTNQNIDGAAWYNFLGFYPTLNMYAFSKNSITENLNFSEFILINKSNGQISNILSLGDGKIENPVPSSKNQYLAYFYNQVYTDNNSFLGIVKFDTKNNLKEFKSFISENFKIYQIAWAENDILLIKTSSDNGKNFKYYKSDILSENNVDNAFKNDEWNGKYFLKSTNRDNINTIYNITINSLENISIKINEDKNEYNYSNLKAEKLNNTKIKIIYNPSSEDEMGTIYIEKLDSDYFISGNPIYFINPGNNEMPLEKIK
ncbi:hypothetical protein GCM10023210_03410 [Chryseobacterium ginsengisoli]|uniref:Lipoprotein n=1 Tax=Chryseobacterium ginsengisoli TaxID=363853 RepID=A0ABP9LRH8_9FLAO